MTAWQFSPKAKRSIRDANARINVWHGAVRSGKTICSIIAWILFVRHLNKRGISGDLLMVGKTERTLKRNILAPLRQIVGARNFRLNRAEGELYLYGRRIYIASANDERSSDKIQGMTLIGAYGDEVTLWPESFFDMLLTRLSLAGSRLFLTMNPAGPYHWFKQRFLDRVDELDMRVWHFTLADNPALDPAYVESLKRLYAVGSMFYKRFVLGLWVAAEGAVYDFWDEGEHTILESALPGDPDELYVSIDYGTSNATSMGLYGLWRTGPLRAARLRGYHHSGRETGRSKTDAQYASDLEDTFGQWRARIRAVILDPSAASFKAELRKRGWNVRDADNTVIDGIRTQARMLQAGEYKVVRHESNAQCIRDYGAYLWDSRAQAKGEDKPIKENDHTKDEERYYLQTVFGGRTTSLATAESLYR